MVSAASTSAASACLTSCSSNAGKALYDCVANVLDKLSNDISSVNVPQTRSALQNAAAGLRAATNKAQALSAISRCRALIAGALRQVRAVGGQVAGWGGGSGGAWLEPLPGAQPRRPVDLVEGVAIPANRGRLQCLNLFFRLGEQHILSVPSWNTCLPGEVHWKQGDDSLQSQICTIGRQRGWVKASVLAALVILGSLFAGRVATAGAGMGEAAATANAGLSSCNGNSGKALYDCVANVIDKMSNEISQAGVPATQAALEDGRSRIARRCQQGPGTLGYLSMSCADLRCDFKSKNDGIR